MAKLLKGGRRPNIILIIIVIIVVIALMVVVVQFFTPSLQEGLSVAQAKAVMGTQRSDNSNYQADNKAFATAYKSILAQAPSKIVGLSSKDQKIASKGINSFKKSIDQMVKQASKEKVSVFNPNNVSSKKMSSIENKFMKDTLFLQEFGKSRNLGEN